MTIGQGECRSMLESRSLPHRGIVALCAVQGEPRRHVVWIRRSLVIRHVTAGTRLRESRVHARRCMTRCAGTARVPVREREIGRMRECRPGPLCRGMALCAIGCE